MVENVPAINRLLPSSNENCAGVGNMMEWTHDVIVVMNNFLQIKSSFIQQSRISNIAGEEMSNDYSHSSINTLIQMGSSPIVCKVQAL